MAYTRQNFEDGTTLNAAQLNAMDEQIVQNESGVDSLQRSKVDKAQSGVTNNAVAQVKNGTIQFTALNMLQTSPASGAVPDALAVYNKLAGKADTSQLSGKADVSALNSKVDKQFGTSTDSGKILRLNSTGVIESASAASAGLLTAESDINLGKVYASALDNGKFAKVGSDGKLVASEIPTVSVIDPKDAKEEGSAADALAVKSALDSAGIKPPKVVHVSTFNVDMSANPKPINLCKTDGEMTVPTTPYIVGLPGANTSPSDALPADVMANLNSPKQFYSPVISMTQDGVTYSHVVALGAYLQGTQISNAYVSQQARIKTMSDGTKRAVCKVSCRTSVSSGVSLVAHNNGVAIDMAYMLL